MKKMLLILLFSIISVPAITFAADGDFPTDLLKLSSGVVGAYSVNADPATNYSVSTAHTQGNMIYASASEDSLIYYKIDETGPLVSADLYTTYADGGLTSTPGDYIPVGTK